MAENIIKPKISVILPVYNGEKYLREAIDSILAQTFTDFELLLINDASTDSTENIILSYKDPRIVYLKNEQNLGLIKTLNKGLDLSRGEFIARMDQDDISNSKRFEKQIKVFENNLKIGVCGTLFTLFSKGLPDRLIMHPEHSDEIKINLLNYCVIGHPTVMLRKSAIGNLRYDNNYKSAEDFEFWSRLTSFTEFYNIQESLLDYRFHQTNISILDSGNQQDNSKKIVENQLAKLGFEKDERHLRYCRILFANDTNYINSSELINMINFSKEFEKKNNEKKFYNQKLLAEIIEKNLFAIFIKAKKDNWRLIPFVFINKREFLLKRSLLTNLKMIVKIILRI